jgi:hypothetical protein
MEFLSSSNTLPLAGTENSVHTGCGLVVKNVARLAAVQARMELLTVAHFHAFQICRSVRRDFNLISAKMYMRSSKKELRAQIQELLLEVQIEAENLKAESLAFGASPEPDIRTVELRLVSAESAVFFKSLMLADEVIGRLNFACKNQVITTDNIEMRIAPFYRAYTDLKLFVVGGQRTDKTAAQLGNEGGIA